MHQDDWRPIGRSTFEVGDLQRRGADRFVHRSGFSKAVTRRPEHAVTASTTMAERRRYWQRPTRAILATPDTLVRMRFGEAMTAWGGGCVNTPDCNGRREWVFPVARDLGANLDFL